MSMNMNFILDDSGSLDGYHNVKIQDINNVVNGFVDNVICNCLDLLDFNQRESVLQAIVSKLAFEGTATFRFINATMLAGRIIKNELNSSKVSAVIGDAKSLWTDSTILETVSALPNIQIQKNYIENIYTVISVKKIL